MAIQDDMSVQTPCVMICTLDDNDICVGCSRTLDEIGSWADADNDQRNKILDDIALRVS